jgi:GNAT superfamily N-acetyltransferase
MNSILGADAEARMAASETSISSFSPAPAGATRYDYNGRVFRSVQNSPNGQVDDATIFQYWQEGNVLSATYRGGAIRQGTMIGLVDGEGRLDFRYQHVNADGEIMTGECRSTPEILPDGRIRLHERWRWTCKDFSEGESIVEEIGAAPEEHAAAFAARHWVVNGEYAISANPARLDPAAVHEYIQRSYWAPTRPRAISDKALANSLCFGLYHDGRQVGLARVVTDYATIAYLCDVYVLEEHRGHGLGKWLIDVVLQYPPLKTVGTWFLATRDAHGLYRRYGFETVEPGRHMTLRRNRPQA